MPAEILLIRHGQTNWNTLKRLQGHSDIPLNEKGLEQAHVLSDTLKDVDIAAIYASDLLRASVTAEIIAEKHNVPLILTRRLRERCYGACEGLKDEEIRDRYPESYKAWYAADPDHFFPDGERKTESPRQFYNRVRSILSKLAAIHCGERIAVVAHFGVVETALRLSEKIPLGQVCTRPVLNTSINRFAVDLGEFELLEWGQASHLEEGKQKIDYFKHF